MPKQWTGSWKIDGMTVGRTTVDQAGAKVYVLRKQDARLAAAGLSLRPTIFLGAVSRDEALAAYGRFNQDPVAFVKRQQQPLPDAKPTVEPININAKLIEPFLKYLTDTKQRNARYINNVGFYLAAWGADLHGRDLKTVTYPDLLRVLASYPRSTSSIDSVTGNEVVETKAAARKHRVAALKSLTAYLRDHLGTLKHSEDPTISLKVPVSEPEKVKRARKGGRKGYEMKDLERLYAAINSWASERPGWSTKTVDVQSVRDVVLVKCKTGMHFTEIARLAQGSGTVKTVRQGEIAATITFLHKKGKMHVQSIDKQTLAAVLRLQARGSVPVESYIKKVIAKALVGIGKSPIKDAIRFGELRHSFVTWAREQGALERPKDGGLSYEDIAAAIGHESTRMTSTRYDNSAIPPMVKIPIKLAHPEDPVLLVPREAAG